MILKYRTLAWLSVLMFSTWNYESQVIAIPVDEIMGHSDSQISQDYAILKQGIIYDLGYTKEFADLVEVNLKRAVKEEVERQRQQGIVVPVRLRQGNQPPSDEYDEDESTTAPQPTTPGVLPGDVVRGVAGIITSLGTFNVKNFWQSFVNFFPPNQRESAQALVDASNGRRPANWPTLPTTTTKLTTTTKDEDEVDSEETTKPTVTTAPVITATQTGGAVSASAAVTSSSVVVGATPAVIQSVTTSYTATGTRAPTTKYTLIRRRTGTGTELPEGNGLRIDDTLLMPVAITTTPNSF